MLEPIAGTFRRLRLIASQLRDGETGQTLVEYALIIALVSIGTTAALLVLTGKINDVFTTISGTL